MAGNEFEDGQGSFWSLRDKREQQVWFLPSLFPRDFGGNVRNGEFLGGNEGAAAGLGRQSRVCSRLARKGAFPRSRLANPTGGAEVGCQRARRWLQLSPYLQQGGCHAQPRPRHRSSGTAPGSGQAKISPGESPAWWEEKNLWAARRSNRRNSCRGGGSTRKRGPDPVAAARCQGRGWIGSGGSRETSLTFTEQKSARLSRGERRGEEKPLLCG